MQKNTYNIIGKNGEFRTRVNNDNENCTLKINKYNYGVRPISIQTENSDFLSKNSHGTNIETDNKMSNEDDAENRKTKSENRKFFQVFIILVVPLSTLIFMISSLIFPQANALPPVIRIGK